MSDPEGPGPTGSGDAQPAGESEKGPELDFDSAFAAIIADFATSVPRGSGPWPASEDLDDEDDDGLGSASDPRAGSRTEPGDRPDDGGPDGARADGGRTDGSRPDAGRSDAGRPEGGRHRLSGHRSEPSPQKPASGEPGSDRSDAERQEPGRPDAGRKDPGRRRIVLPDDDVDLSVSPAVARGPRDWEPAEEEDEGFVPPVPPPLPRGDLVSRIAWGAVIGGPLFLLVAALAWKGLPSALLLVSLLAFIGGFVTLVARMPAERPDDPDDGAIV